MCCYRNIKCIGKVGVVAVTLSSMPNLSDLKPLFVYSTVQTKCPGHGCVRFLQRCFFMMSCTKFSFSVTVMRFQISHSSLRMHLKRPLKPQAHMNKYKSPWLLSKKGWILSFPFYLQAVAECLPALFSCWQFIFL